MESSSEKNTFQPCCFQSFAWNGTPSGKEEHLHNHDVYVAGNNPKSAVLFLHDALGWQYPNNRLLADHYAQEANVTVYMPDFFGGEDIDQQMILEGRWSELGVKEFRHNNRREVRQPEILSFTKYLREEKKVEKLAAAGFCWGGWGCLVLASQTPGLLDAVVIAHPSWLTKEDFENVHVPLLVLAPEKDKAFTDELKMYAFEKFVIKQKSTPFAYVHFPGMTHGCLTKGSEEVKGEREAMAKGKNAAVEWFKEYLS